MRIIIGAAGTQQADWLATEQHELDVTKRDDFEHYFGDQKADAFLLSDVLEHLIPNQLLPALRNLYAFLKPGGYVRIAVPDGYHPDPEYIAYVSPPNMGHQALYNHHSMSDLLAQAGFRPALLEWWSTDGKFNYVNWYEKDGYIERCLANDPRNKDGQPHYTSLIIDARKLVDQPGKPGLEKAFDFIRENDTRGLSEYNRRKATAFYELARSAPVDGVVIELGCYHGFGTVPLYYGAQDGNHNRVLAVDAYQDMRGWIGEPYGPSDELVWYENMTKACAHPVLVKGDCLTLAAGWTEPIALLIHDLGSMNRMPADVLAWERHIMVGGTLAMRDLDNYSMGTEAACAALIATGRWGKRVDWPAFITSLERIA